MEKSERVFKQFLELCREVTDNDTIVLTLLQRHYNHTNPHFLWSDDFSNLVDLHCSNIQSDPTNKYVHIREFITELKAYQAKPLKHLIQGRGLPAETHIEPPAKHIKLEADVVKEEATSSICPSQKLLKPSPAAKCRLIPLSVITSRLSDAATQDAQFDTGMFHCESSIINHVDVPEENPCHDVDGATGIAGTSNEIMTATDISQCDSSSEVMRNDDQMEDGAVENASRGSQNQIVRLEKLLERISRKIKKLDERELTLEEMDQEDSSFLLVECYKKRFVKVWNKLCQVKGRTLSTGREVEKPFRFHGTKYNQINQMISRFINKFHVFPDFQDIHNIIVRCNRKYELKIKKQMTESLARDAFTSVGNLLQQKRIKDFVSNFGCHLTDSFKEHDDPALFDYKLRHKLESNRKVGCTKLEQVINKFVEHQENGNEKSDESSDESEEGSDTDLHLDIDTDITLALEHQAMVSDSSEVVTHEGDAVCLSELTSGASDVDKASDVTHEGDAVCLDELTSGDKESDVIHEGDAVCLSELTTGACDVDKESDVIPEGNAACVDELTTGACDVDKLPSEAVVPVITDDSGLSSESDTVHSEMHYSSTSDTVSCNQPVTDIVSELDIDTPSSSQSGDEIICMDDDITEVAFVRTSNKLQETLVDGHRFESTIEIDDDANSTDRGACAVDEMKKTVAEAWKYSKKGTAFKSVVTKALSQITSTRVKSSQANQININRIMPQPSKSRVIGEVLSIGSKSVNPKSKISSQVMKKLDCPASTSVPHRRSRQHVPCLPLRPEDLYEISSQIVSQIYSQNKATSGAVLDASTDDVVLICDDDETVKASLMDTVADDEGIVVLDQADNTEQAQIARTASYDVITLDTELRVWDENKLSDVSSDLPAHCSTPCCDVVDAECTDQSVEMSDSSNETLVASASCCNVVDSQQVPQAKQTSTIISSDSSSDIVILDTQSSGQVTPRSDIVILDTQSSRQVTPRNDIVILDTPSCRQVTPRSVSSSCDNLLVCSDADVVVLDDVSNQCDTALTDHHVAAASGSSTEIQDELVDYLNSSSKHTFTNSNLKVPGVETDEISTIVCEDLLSATQGYGNEDYCGIASHSSGFCLGDKNIAANARRKFKRNKISSVSHSISAPSWPSSSGLSHRSSVQSDLHIDSYCSLSPAVDLTVCDVSASHRKSVCPIDSGDLVIMLD